MDRLLINTTALLIMIFCQASGATAEQLAFPGAEGFGAYSKGGRGGQVLYVTNLDDQGEGSLRSAVEKEGPRTIVFGISGTIELKKTLEIKNPFITIAGQTAPGDGICLKGETLLIHANNVIIRYIRVRLGDGKYGIGSKQGKDAISVRAGEDIIIDHCSSSWTLDEVLSVSSQYPTLTRITVQWCFITEALNPDGHGFGSLIRGTGGAKYSYLHNLYAHNCARSPRPGNYNRNSYDKDPLGLLLDFRNNVLYNWARDHSGYNSDRKSVTRLNYVGNYLIPGENSEPGSVAYSTGSTYNHAYFAGNYFNDKLPDNPWSLVKFSENYPWDGDFRYGWTDEKKQAYMRTEPFEAGYVQLEDAPTAYKRVLESGGASLPKRDAVDIRIVNDIKKRTGKIINSQNEVGGWPELKSRPAPTDSDGDGMPDAWETRYGLDPNDAADGTQDKDGDSYTNIEEYLNGTDPTEFVDYSKAENNINILSQAIDPRDLLLRYMPADDMMANQYRKNVTKELGELALEIEGTGKARTITNTIIVPPNVAYDGKGEILTADANAMGANLGDQSERQKPLFLLTPGAGVKKCHDHRSRMRGDSHDG